MSKTWSAGTFVAKAKELCRRLECWHIEDYRSPITLVNEQGSRRCVRLTFRNITASTSAQLHNRPESFKLYLDEDSESGKCIGFYYRNPERLEDHSLTQWLMGEFRIHLEECHPSSALDYLKESFNQILNLPAWTVRLPRNPVEEAMVQSFSGQYLVVGLKVPAEYLDTLTKAAEKFFDVDCLTKAPSPGEPTGKSNTETPSSQGKEQISLAARITAFLTDRAKKLGKIPTFAEVQVTFPGQIGSKATFYRKNRWYSTVRKSLKTTLMQLHEPIKD